VVLWRRNRRGALEVYWVRRGLALPFMGGWHAFPGGAAERSDIELPVAGAPRERTPGGRTPGLPDLAALPDDIDVPPGLAATGLRELFEETGVLLGRGRLSEAADRRAAGEAFAASLAAADVALDADRLVFAGRWLTPPFAPVRFDNRFFLAAWRPEDGEPAASPPESESGEWIAPALALERIAEGPALAAPPIVHILRVLDEDGPEHGLERLLDTAEANLGPLRRIELRSGILLFPLATATLPPATHTNAFLVGHGEALLVDPGSRSEVETGRLLAALDAAHHRLGRRAIAVVLTHHHPDHVSGVPAVVDRLRLPVWAHAATAERVADLGILVDRHLKDGDLIALRGEPASTIRCHHTPGHARGHLALEVVESGDLLAGDLVAGISTIVVDPPEGDMDDYLDSLARLQGRGLRTLFPAHGPPSVDADAKLAELLEHRLARELQILERWRAGVREPEAMVPEIYPDIPAAVRPLAVRQIVAHLDRLGRQRLLREG
jgi:glyoxylase-like metal-dependent hydrolase (beta-lactamase superfamily II)/8-oxo-dGTP pyrophosphatase MutT (NUDIX family)